MAAVGGAWGDGVGLGGGAVGLGVGWEREGWYRGGAGAGKGPWEERSKGPGRCDPKALGEAIQRPWEVRAKGPERGDPKALGGASQRPEGAGGQPGPEIIIC